MKLFVNLWLPVNPTGTVIGVHGGCSPLRPHGVADAYAEPSKTDFGVRINIVVMHINCTSLETLPKTGLF